MPQAVQVTVPLPLEDELDELLGEDEELPDELPLLSEVEELEVELLELELLELKLLELKLLELKLLELKLLELKLLELDELFLQLGFADGVPLGIIEFSVQSNVYRRFG